MSFASPRRCAHVSEGQSAAPAHARAHGRLQHHLVQAAHPVRDLLSSPWVLYQVWAFIAPGLYKRERRWAVPFVLTSAGLFLLAAHSVTSFCSATPWRSCWASEWGRRRSRRFAHQLFDLFVNVMLGVGLVFEMPVLIFFLTFSGWPAPPSCCGTAATRFWRSSSRRDLHTDAGRLQPDVIRHTHVHAVLRRIFASYLWYCTARTHVSVAYDYEDNPRSTIALSHIALYCHYKVRVKLVPHWPFVIR